MNEQSLRYLIEHTRYNDTESVKSSLNKLSTLPEGTDINPLLEALNSDNTHIRKFAAEALGIIKNDKAVPHLIKALNDKSIYVRKLSADALGNIGSKTAVPHLIQIINDENIYVRWAIAEAFGKIKDRTTVPYLIDLLNDQSAYVRWSSAKALGNIEDTRAIIHLKKLLEDEDSLVKVTARSVLNKFEEITDKKSQEDSSLNKEDTIALPVIPQKKRQEKRIKNKLLLQKKEIMELLSKSKTKNLPGPVIKETGEERGIEKKNIKDKMLSIEHILDKNTETKKLPFKEVIALYSREKYDTKNPPIEHVIELLSTHDIKSIPIDEKEEVIDITKDGNIKSFESIVNAIDSFISNLNKEEKEEEQQEDSFDELFGLIDYIIDELKEDKTIPIHQMETTGEVSVIKEEKKPVSEKKEGEIYRQSIPAETTEKVEIPFKKEEKEALSDYWKSTPAEITGKYEETVEEKEALSDYWKSTPAEITGKKIEEKYLSQRIPLRDKKIFPAKTEEIEKKIIPPGASIKEKTAEAIKKVIIEEKPVRDDYKTGEKEIKLPDKQCCPVCLKKLTAGKKFCIYCGYKLPEHTEQDIVEKHLHEEKFSDEIPEKHLHEEKFSDEIPEKYLHEEKKSQHEHIHKYINDLNNPSTLVRLKSVIKLGETDSEEASEALITKLKNGDKEDIRWRIIESLGKLNKSNSVDILIHILKTEIPDIKIKIIETLAILGDKKAAKSVTEELKSNLSVKLAAIETLGILGDKEIVPELIRELEDKDPTVRIRTVEALGKLGDKRAIEPIKNARKKEGIFSIIMKSTMTSVIKKLENN